MLNYNTHQQQMDDMSETITLGDFQIAINNGHLALIYPLNMVTFQSYGSLPKGTFFSWHFRLTMN